MINFTKMQSLGNDFVVIDATKTPIHLSPDQITRMADRHFGIGFDQLMMLEPANSNNVDFSYRIFNADGGEVEQCGNGVRCLARFIIESELSDKTNLTLAAKKTQVSVILKKDQVQIQMGVPQFSPEAIPFDAPKVADRYLFMLTEKETYEIGVVSLGNPHAVMQVESLDDIDVDRIGETISTHARFPEQVNVGFMQVLDRNSIRLRVYERGVGETLACGTGACAAVVIGQLWNLLDADVNIALSGGDLKVSWSSKDTSVELTGSAEFVFFGTWHI